MNSAVFIEGRRSGYSPDQCNGTMTVADLKSFLDNFDDDAKIFISNDNGYTYGNVDCSSFTSGKYDSEDVYLDE